MCMCACICALKKNILQSALVHEVIYQTFIIIEFCNINYLLLNRIIRIKHTERSVSLLTSYINISIHRKYILLNYVI